MSRTRAGARRALLVALLAGALAAGGCSGDRAASEDVPHSDAASTGEATSSAAAPDSRASAQGLAVATFAGGCFWCMEPPFEKLDGVVSAVSGYTGGHDPKPHYDSVSAGVTGHAEAVEVTFDPTRVSYETLLQVFWHNIDPTTPDRQFCDEGNQYRSAIFFHGEEQRRLAEASKQELERSERFAKTSIVTEIVAAGPFFRAEEYHQDYYVKNPLRYSYYRSGCGRDSRLKQIWGESAGH